MMPTSIRALLILMYAAMSELARVVGPEKLKAIFFGPLPANVKLV